MGMPVYDKEQVDEVIAEKDAEIERLQTIVDKLPKTQDGVRVLPGDIVYRRGPGGIERRNVQWCANQVSLPGYWAWFGIKGPPVPVSECYSTREAAAEAWLEKNTPTNEHLKELADRFPAPQDGYDE